MKFKIVVPCYNGAPWIEKCLASIEQQTYTDYDVCLIDDASTQPEVWEMMESYAKRNGWLSIRNTENKKALHNIVNGFTALECADEDVLMIIDGDDWLFSPWVFEKLTSVYEKDVWLTFGQYVCFRSGELGCAKKPRRGIVRRRLYREKGWRYSHLRTFKGHLWKAIDDADLRNAAGDYYPSAWDLAIMFPMLEMAGPRIKHIPEVLYVYNDANPLCDFRINYEEQQENNRHIRSRRKYDLCCRT